MIGEVSTDDVDTSPEQPDPNRKAMVESIGMMANKGWLAERKLMVMNDYLKARRLYADFNEFIRRLK